MIRKMILEDLKPQSDRDEVIELVAAFLDSCNLAQMIVDIEVTATYEGNRRPS